MHKAMKRKRCYYEVLHVRLTSTLSQIRHSYHQLAMKYHPDKNKTESAKEHFQEINEAYSILSNPSEKLFYDRHRETIIKNWNADLDLIPEPENKEPGALLPFEAEANFWPFFARPAYLGIDDSEHGFYTVYRNIFKAIQYDVEQINDFVRESEESSLVDPSTQYLIVRAPSFGDSETKLLEVAQFYIFWENLPGILEEAWRNLSYSGVVDKHEAILEEDEAERMLLQQRFIDMIRNLVAYVKRVDPRYLEYKKNKALLDEPSSLDLAVQSYNGPDLIKRLANLEQTLVSRIDDIIIPGYHHHHDEENCLECWNWAVLNLKKVLDYGRTGGMTMMKPENPMEIAGGDVILPLPMSESSNQMEEEIQNGIEDQKRYFNEEVGIEDAEDYGLS